MNRYGGCNFRGFDIANHWNEWAGGTTLEMNGEPEYSRFPNEQQQKDFCAAYIAQSESLKAGGARMNKEQLQQEIQSLHEESCKFVLINHWYWGLWAINQAADEGVDTFDYLTYAKMRISEYYKQKEAFL